MPEDAQARRAQQLGEDRRRLAPTANDAVAVNYRDDARPLTTSQLAASVDHPHRQRPVANLGGSADNDGDAERRSPARAGCALNRPEDGRTAAAGSCVRSGAGPRSVTDRPEALAREVKVEVRAHGSLLLVFPGGLPLCTPTVSRGTGESGLGGLVRSAGSVLANLTPTPELHMIKQLSCSRERPFAVG